MKRIWIAVIFLVVSIVACGYEQITFKSRYEDIINIIDVAVECEDESEKKEYCYEIIDSWEGYLKKISVLIDESNLKDADVCIRKIKSCTNYKDECLSDDLNETLIETKSELEQIYDSSKIKFSNIF